jgi:type IV secretory pathway TrbD component
LLDNNYLQSLKQKVKMVKLFFKRNWIHFLSIGIFFAITALYFLPQFQGHRLKQHDIVQFKGMANETEQFREFYGEESLWTNSMFGGMPTYQINVIYDGNWIKKSIQVMRLWMHSPAGYFFIYLIGFYILLMCMKVDPKIAIVGAIAFAFSTYFIIILQAGHNTKALAIGLMSPVIGAFYLAYRRSIKWGILLSALFMGMQIAANHLQITYYMGILLLCLGIAELIRKINAKEGLKTFFITTIGLLFAYGFALSINYGNIALTNEYAQHTIRGGNDITIQPDGSSNEKERTSGLDKDYVTQWSYGIGESLTLLSPYIKGGSSGRIKDSQFSDLLKDDSFRKKAPVIGDNDVYWGDQPFTSGPVYVGIVVLLLALLGMVYLQGPLKWALFTAALISLLLAFGKNFNKDDLLVLNILLVLATLLFVFLKKPEKFLFATLSALGFLLFFLGADEMPLTNLLLDYLPGYNKFRAVTIILAIVEFVIPLIGVLFLALLLDKRQEIQQNPKPFYITSFGLLAALFLLLVTGIGDNYLKSAENDLIVNYAEDVREQILAEDPNRMLQQFNLDVNDPNAMQQFIQNQTKVVDEQFSAVADFRKTVFQKSIIRSVIFLLFGIGLLVLFLKGVIKPTLFLLGLGAIILADLIPVNLNYLNNEKQGAKYKHWIETEKFDFPHFPNKADMEVYERELFERPDIKEAIASFEQEHPNIFGRENRNENEKWSRRFQALNRQTHYRVFEPSGGFSSSRSSYFHSAIGGYHGAKLRRIQNLYDFHIAQNNIEILNMLNVKYILQNEGVQVNHRAHGNAWFVPKLIQKEHPNLEILSLGTTYEILDRSDKVNVFVNDSLVKQLEVFGFEDFSYEFNGKKQPLSINRIRQTQLSSTLAMDINGITDWIPNSELLKDTTDSFEALLTVNIKSKFAADQFAIVTPETYAQVGNDRFTALGSISLRSYAPNELIYDVMAEGEQFAVFSEMYYPDGWNAYLNGEQIAIHRVNYTLRGIHIPDGKHELVMRFEVPKFHVANQIALAGSLLLFLLIIGAFLKDYKSFFKSEDFNKLAEKEK